MGTCTASYWLPVMTYSNSCLVQTFPWIITSASLFFFLSVVRRHAAWGRQELHHCLPSPCLDYTKAVCGPDPRWDWSWNYCRRCEQHQYRLPLYGQVPHHYLGDLLTRIPHSWAVKSLWRLPIGRYFYPQHHECTQMYPMQLSHFVLNVCWNTAALLTASASEKRSFRPLLGWCILRFCTALMLPSVVANHFLIHWLFSVSAEVDLTFFLFKHAVSFTRVKRFSRLSNYPDHSQRTQTLTSHYESASGLSNSADSVKITLREN